MKFSKYAAVITVLALAACSGGNAGEGTSYDEQLSCYTTLMGVNAANREAGDELPGATNALMAMKTLEMEGGEMGEKVPKDIHASSFKIQEIMALAGSPEGAEELAKLQAEAESCSEKFKS